MSQDTLTIGKKLVELCQQGKNAEALDTLYSKNIVSIEAMENAEMPQTQKGIEAIKQKNAWWYENHEVHGGVVQGPFPNGDQFAVLFNFDVTFKPTNNRMKMEEVALYTVADGKITQEQFFYTADEC